MKNLKNKMKKVYKKITYSMLALSLMIMNAPLVYAKGDIITGDSNEIMRGVYGIFFTFAKFMGGGFFVVGGIQLAMAFKNDDPEAKAKAFPMMIAGIFLVGLKTLLNAIPGVSF